MRLPAHFTAARDEYLAARQAAEEALAAVVHDEDDASKKAALDTAAARSWEARCKLVAATRGLTDGLTTLMALSFQPKRSRR